MYKWEKGNKWIAFLFFLPILLFHFTSYSQIDFWMNHKYSIPSPAFITYVRAAYRTMYIAFLGIIFWNIRMRISQANEINELKIQALEQRNREIELENDILRARVDPHLLFNTLNLCYAGTKVNSPKEAKALGLLSKIMKFSLGNIDAEGKVPLKDELEYIGSYIELNQLLNNNNLQLKFKHAASTLKNGLMIPPIILMDFVQDVFKHGNLEDRSNPATISIMGIGNELHFNIENAIAESSAHEGIGVGMENTRKRLQQHYPDNHNLNIDQTSTHFKLNLKIAL
jgi:two-component system LytT family sensor kinase